MHTSLGSLTLNTRYLALQPMPPSFSQHFVSTNHSQKTLLELCAYVPYILCSHMATYYGAPPPTNKKRGTLLIRSARALHLAIARCPPYSSHTALAKLNQLPTLTNTINQQATILLLRHPDLRRRFVLPWLHNTRNRVHRKGFQLRNYISTLLTPFTTALQQYQTAQRSTLVLLPTAVNTAHCSIQYLESPPRDTSPSAYDICLAYAMHSPTMTLHLFISSRRPYSRWHRLSLTAASPSNPIFIILATYILFASTPLSTTALSPRTFFLPTHNPLFVSCSKPPFLFPLDWKQHLVSPNCSTDITATHITCMP